MLGSHRNRFDMSQLKVFS